MSGQKPEVCMKNLPTLLSILFLFFALEGRCENETSPEIAHGGGGGGGGGGHGGGGHGGAGRGDGEGHHGDPDHYDREYYEEGNSGYFYDAEEYPPYDDEGNFFWEEEETEGGEWHGEHKGDDHDHGDHGHGRH